MKLVNFPPCTAGLVHCLVVHRTKWTPARVMLVKLHRVAVELVHLAQHMNTWTGLVRGAVNILAEYHPDASLPAELYYEEDYEEDVAWPNFSEGKTTHFQAMD